MNRGHYDVPATQRGLDAANFATKREKPTRNPARRVFEIAPVSEGESVLDLPCGDASFSLIYATAARAVIALDSRQAMLKIARQAVEERGLANVFVRAIPDPGALPDSIPEASFDLVLAHHLREFAEPALILGEAKKQAKRAVIWAEPVGPEDKNGRNFLDSLLEQRNGFRSRSLSESMCVALAEQGGWQLQDRQPMRYLRTFEDWSNHLPREEKSGLRDDLVDDMEDNDADLFPHFAGRKLCFLERWMVLHLVRGSGNAGSRR